MGPERRVKKATPYRGGFLLGILGVGLCSAWAIPAENPAFRARVDCEVEHLLRIPPLAWSKDPFKKIAGWAAPVPEEKARVPVLEAVLFGISESSEREAILDGKRYRQGEECGPFLVQAIGENFVVLDDGDSTVELALPNSAPSGGRIAIHALSEGARKRELDDRARKERDFLDSEEE